MKNKAKFLKSEYYAWEYWQGFSYAEYLRTMKTDAVKCDCGVYHWKECKKFCNCKYHSLTSQELNKAPKAKIS